MTHEYSDKVTLRDTLLANSGPDCQVLYGAPFVSAGHNLSGDSSCTALTAAGDLRRVTAALAPLAVNTPGTTATHALPPNSAAINRGGDCPATDQRGSGRPVGIACDVGAYELSPLPVPTIAGVSPSGGPHAGGDLLTITGTGFYLGTSVTVGGNACANVIVSYDTGQLTCTAPAGTSGPQDVVVTDPGAGAATATGTYYYGRPHPVGSTSGTMAAPQPVKHPPGPPLTPAMPAPQPVRH